MYQPVTLLGRESGLGGPDEGRCEHHCQDKLPLQILMRLLPRLRAVYDQLDSFTVTFFDCGRSEHTLHPQVREVLEFCLEFGAAYFPTGNSVSF